MEVVNNLFERLEEKLNIEAEQHENKVCLATRSVAAVVDSMSALKAYIKDYAFKNQEEEIHFFKKLKPRFSSQLIYFLKVQKIETERPNGSHKVQCEYFSQELDRLKYFFDNNLAFYKYYRNDATHLDEKYFTRQPYDINLNLDPHVFDHDPSFSTSHDYKIARLLANEMLENYLKNALADLEMQEHKSTEKIEMPKFKLSWTGSKAALIELVYGLHSVGTFNNAKADIKHIAAYLEAVFNVDLGNYYRTFQEIRIRKKNRTSFLDTLKNGLVNKMDEIDEFPNSTSFNGNSYRKAV